MKKNRFFDTIIISLILMSCFKLLYPDAFTFNIVVNSSTSDSSNNNGSNNNGSEDDKLDLPEYDTYLEFYDYLSDSSIGGLLNSNDDLYCGSNLFYADCSEVSVVLVSTGADYVINGTPYCYVNGVLWYYFDTDDSFSIELLENGGYVINSICEWICLESFV